jgi:glutamate-1-semialdehyde 2,1-aminomutase
MGTPSRKSTRLCANLLARGTALGLPTESEIALAELLNERTGYAKWRFSNSGTEAVMTAIRAAHALAGRDLIPQFEGSYPGTSDAVASESAPEITEGVRSDVVELPQGDLAAFDQAVDRSRSRIAAVLIDLMPNRAGLVPAQPEFAHHIPSTTQDIGGQARPARWLCVH